MKYKLFSIVAIFFLFPALFSCSPKVEKANSIFPKFEDAKVGVLVGTSFESFLSKNYPELNTFLLDNNADLFLALDQEKIDIMIYDGISFKLDDSRSKDVYTICRDSLITEKFGVAFSKENTSLMNEFNSFLKKIKKDGTFDIIYNNWLVPGAKNQMPDLSNIERSGEPLNIAVSGAYAYFDMVAHGRNVGFDPEMMERFAAYLKRPIEFHLMNFSSLVPSIASRKCDAAASSIAITDERSKMINFSDPYLVSYGVGIALKKNFMKEKDMKAVELLKNKKIGVMIGSTHEKYISDLMGTKAEILCYDTAPDLYLALDQGKIEYAVDDGTSFSLSNHAKGRIYNTIIDTLFTENFGFTFNKEESELRDKFNDFISKIKKDGTLAQVHKNWLTPDGANYMPDFSSVERSGDPIKVSCTSSNHYFDIIMNGKHAGYDIEIVERFAASIKRPVEYFSSSFAGTLTSVITGKTDMGCGGVTITEDRKKNLDFSDSHYISYSTVFSKNNTSASKTYSSMKDLKDKTIGVMTGSAQDILASKDYPQATFLRTDLSSLVASLIAHKCDVVLIPQVMAQEVLVYNTQLAALYDDLYPSEIGAVFNKNRPELRKQFNDFLKFIKGNGEYDRIYKKYIENPYGPDSIAVDIPAVDLSLPKLTIYTEGVLYPFSFTKGDKLIGMDMELVRDFAKYIGKRAVISNVSFDAIIPAIAQGKADMAISSIMITPERASAVDFSDSYCSVHTSALVRKENMKTPPVLKGDGSDLANATVGVLTGSLGEFYITDHYPEASIKCFDDITDAYQALSSDKIDYVFTSYTTSVCASQNINNIYILPKEYTREGAAIAFRKDEDPKLIARVNGVIAKFINDGTMGRIIDKWVTDDPSTYTMSDVVVPDDGPLLNIAIAANREPMCFIKDGQYMGLDVELISRIAAELNMKPVFHDMKFSALTASLLSGKTDLIISNFTKTAEREEKVVFSDEYFRNPQKLVTKIISEDSHKTVKASFFSSLKNSFYNNLILEKRYKLILSGLRETLIISIFSILLGTLFGAGVCALRMAKSKFLSSIAKGFIDLMRGTPILVFLMIIFYVVFAKVNISATVVAIIAFALNFAAYASEMFRTSIEGVDRGQTEAGAAMGFTKWQTFFYIVLPQAIKRVMPVYKGESISLLKMTSIVGYIAVQDLTKASDIIRSRTFDAFFPLIVITIIYFVLAWLLGLALDSLNTKINKRK
jgi:polar amino acid transport system substrate-binding protein